MNDVTFEDHFDEYEQALYQATHRALDAAADIAVAEVRASPTPYELAPILDSAMRTGVERTSKGQGVFIVLADWRGILFELGTYRRRKRPLKQPRRSDRPNRGVRPGYFLIRATRTAKKSIPELLRREFEQIRL